MKLVNNVRPPSAMSRALFRAPIHLYQLGWLFGKHILLLNHTERVSGQQRQAVLEVVDNRAHRWRPGEPKPRRIDASNP